MKAQKIPLLGIAVFVVLYGCATRLYPGGNQADTTAPGFDWLHNYWCDLLGPQADNGMPNPARPVAMVAMAILGSAMAFFWYRLAGFLSGSRHWRAAVRVSGIVSMVTACLLFTSWHDTALAVSGGTALVALGATLVYLHQAKENRLLQTGLVCMVLFVANNAVYWTKTGLEWLPLIQKVAFLAFLYWIARVSLLLKR